MQRNGKGMSYGRFSGTTSIIVRVRYCGLAVPRRRRRAFGGFRSGLRFLVISPGGPFGTD